MKIDEINKQELIEFLKENKIIPDVKCSQEDLEALIFDEELESKLLSKYINK